VTISVRDGSPDDIGDLADDGGRSPRENARMPNEEESS
jgi:hypothetical protein